MLPLQPPTLQQQQQPPHRLHLWYLQLASHVRIFMRKLVCAHYLGSLGKKINILLPTLEELWRGCLPHAAAHDFLGPETVSVLLDYIFGRLLTMSDQ